MLTPDCCLKMCPFFVRDVQSSIDFLPLIWPGGGGDGISCLLSSVPCTCRSFTDDMVHVCKADWFFFRRKGIRHFPLLWCDFRTWTRDYFFQYIINVVEYNNNIFNQFITLIKWLERISRLIFTQEHTFLLIDTYILLPVLINIFHSWSVRYCWTKIEID